MEKKGSNCPTPNSKMGKLLCGMSELPKTLVSVNEICKIHLLTLLIDSNLARNYQLFSLSYIGPHISSLVSFPNN